MITLQEFHQDFIQTIISDSDARGLMRAQCFFEHVCESLVQEGELTNNYTQAEYKKTGIEVAGYDYDSERQILTLIAFEYFQDSDKIRTFTFDNVQNKFNRLKNFYTKSVKGLYESLEESFDSYDMAWHIFNWSHQNLISKVRLVLVTDGKSTDKALEIHSEAINEIPVEYSVVDIDYLYKIHLSEHSGGNFSVEELDLPYLKVPASSDKYQSYLVCLPGRVIVDVYEKFGQRLFDQNVRTFLQFRGGVNKGLRNTIKTAPDMFFAYNNGITATATDVTFNEHNHIESIENFQIVNGGQTASSIYASYKKRKGAEESKAIEDSINRINVQMKLSVVKEQEDQNDFVSKVSEYANTQNKVNKSDFFSNSPFHKQFKKYSEVTWVSGSEGAQRKTRWFYERVRGEYLNRQAYLTDAQKRQFLLENPKSQLIEKTFLSKSENSWRLKPYIVSKGAQYSFKEFADYITDQVEKDDLYITEQYFKDAVSRVIIFRAIEKIVTKADWYDGGHRAATVAYTMSYLSHALAQKDKKLNFELIWSLQSVTGELANVLEVIASKVYEKILTPPPGNANVSQWCKKELCWKDISSMSLSIDVPDSLLVSKEDDVLIQKESRKTKKLDTGIEIQAAVIGWNKGQKEALLNYYTDSSNKVGVSSMQLDILQKYVAGRISLPSEKQSKILYTLYEKAAGEGVQF